MARKRRNYMFASKSKRANHGRKPCRGKVRKQM